MEKFNFTLKENRVRTESEEISSLFKNWKGSEERWMFVAPHDDDLALGSGLLMQAAIKAGIPVRAVITTDGHMGFGSSVSKEDIVAVRAKETDDSFKILGVSDVAWLNFPDNALNIYAGAREAVDGDPCVIEGYTGMQNAYTAQMRDFRPTRVFVPAGTDLHPDHKMVYQELLISLFHASGDIWPQLGEPLANCPDIYEMAIYCDFDGEPNIRVIAPADVFETKLNSILAYKSQLQIETLVNNVRNSGPVEYFRDVVFNLYKAEKYNKTF